MIVFIGGSESALPFVEAAHNKGLEVAVFDRDPNCACKDQADIFHNISTHDTPNVLVEVREIGVDGVFSYCSDLKAWNTAHYVADFYSVGLQYHPYRLHKGQIKNLLRLGGIRTPTFITMRGPSVVKLGTSIGSKVQFIPRGESALIEQYVTGVEYNISGYVRDGSFSCLAQTHKVMRNGLPYLFTTVIPTAEWLAQRVADALKIQSSLLSIDFIKDDQGLWVIDVGPLLDVHIDRFLFKFGIDIYNIAIELAIGEGPLWSWALDDGLTMRLHYGSDSQSTADIESVEFGGRS